MKPTTPLNEEALLLSARQIVTDGRINMASKGEVPVQTIEYPNGDKYLLKVTMTLLEKHESI